MLLCMNLSMTSHCDDSFVTCDDIAFGQPFHFLGLICFESVSGSWAVENTVVKSVTMEKLDPKI